MRLPHVIAAILLSCCTFTVADAAIVAGGGWSRETVPGAVVGAGFLTLANEGKLPRTLLRMSSPFAERVEAHETTIGLDGIARMRLLAGLVIKPGEKLLFAPGGRHFMLLGLKEPLRAGTEVPLRLEFEGESPVTAILTVMTLSLTPATSASHAHVQH